MTNEVRIRASIKDEISGPLAKIIDKFERFKTQGAKGFAIGVGAFAAAKGFDLMSTAASAAVGFIGDSIKKASDLNETLSKSSVVFGTSAKSVESWGGTLARSFGISKQAGIEAAASFGNVFTNMGFAQGEAAKMSKQLVELAGDLASFNNISTDDALTKLRSGLAGEAEPLRSMGVFLTEAKVKAKAMELGLADANGELSEGAKVTARYKLILEQTTKAQGDFARTADGLANSQRAATAELDDAQARLGENFLPIQLQGTRVLVEWTAKLDLAATALDVLTGKLDLSKMGYDEQRAALIAAADAYPDYRQRILDQVAALDAAHESTSQEADQAARLATTLPKMGDGLDKGAKGAKHLAGQLYDVKKYAKGADDAIGALVDTIIEDLYGKVIREGDKAELEQQLSDYKDELKDAKRKVEDLASIHDPTAKQRKAYQEAQREVKILTGKVAETKGELLKLDMQMAENDGPEAFKKWFDKIGKSVDKGDDELKDFLAHARAMADLAGKLPKTVPIFFGTVYGKSTRGKAIGGPVHQDEPYVVGEKGPELFVPGASGSIIPNHALKAGSHTGVGSTPSNVIAVNVNVNGAMTPATARALGDELGPTIYDYLYRRGALGRA